MNVSILTLGMVVERTIALMIWEPNYRLKVFAYMRNTLYFKYMLGDRTCCCYYQVVEISNVNNNLLYIFEVLAYLIQREI